MSLEWIVLLMGGVLAGLTQGFGHYFFRKPRREMVAPWTYLYGVGGTLIWLLPYAFVRRDWCVIIPTALVFICAGFAVLASYGLDALVEKSHRETDLQARVKHLQELIDGQAEQAD